MNKMSESDGAKSILGDSNTVIIGGYKVEKDEYEMKQVQT